MTERKYSAVAGAMELVANITNSQTSLVVDTFVGLPLTTPYTLILDAGDSAKEEVVTVTAQAGSTMTVIRGEDGTANTTHTAGAVIRHGFSARDFREPQQHIEATAGVHGLGPSASVVGTDSVQTLTGKTIDGDDNNLSVTQEQVSGLDATLIAAAAAAAALVTAEAGTRATADTAEATARAAGDTATLVSASPPGVLAPYAAASAPSGWLLCDGSAVSRSTYAALFAIVGVVYGVGNGTTTFTLPNLKGKIPVGLDSGQTEFDTLAETGGAKTVTLTEATMPAHTHTATTASSGLHNHSGGASVFFADNFSSQRTAGAGSDGAFTTASTVQQNAGAHTHTVTVASTGDGGAHANLQPYIVMNWIIKT